MKILVPAVRIACVVLLVCSTLAQEPAPGALQASIEQSIKGRAGAIVILNVSTGKILASLNLNVAAQRLEQPGSTVKPFVLMELLAAGKIRPEQRLACRRPLYIAGRRMDCSHPVAVQTLDAPDAIAWSCNSYFASIATQLTRAELAKVYQHAGFTSLTGLAPSEVAGRLSPADDQPHLQLQALGHWGIEVTPLELLAAYRSLALQKLHNSDLGSAAPVFDGMQRAVKYGIAHEAQPTGTTAAGKTGTASGVSTPAAHGFFVGYAPADKPEIVLVVYLEHGRGIDAAAIAAPVFTAWAKHK